MNQLLCALLGHPAWRETRDPAQDVGFGQQYMVKFGAAPAEIEAEIVGGRSFRCVRCHRGRVEMPPPKREWDWK